MCPAKQRCGPAVPIRANKLGGGPEREVLHRESKPLQLERERRLRAIIRRRHGAAADQRLRERQRVHLNP